MESKINVTVRMKPLSDSERAQEKNQIWSQVSDNTIANVKSKEMFAFDMVFGEKISTQEIFDSQIRELVNTAMSGINVTVFAYGQTSSGKTYTMRGYHNSDPGLIPLSIQQVFDYINSDKERNYTISVSYLEIYNESLNDLIEPQNKNLEIRESISKGIYINRLSECAVNSRDEVLKYMWQGDDARIIAETKLNEQSSRSHTVFRITITSKQADAGSEGASRTQADGLRLREGSNINRSLLALSNVINRLSTAGGGKTFINFRDSKLTRILQPALGGNSKTAIICTMTQTLSNYQETVNTLHFGQKAKHVKTTVNVNEINQGLYNGQSGPEMEKAMKEICELKAKLKEYELKLSTSFQQQSSTIQNTTVDVTMSDASSIQQPSKESSDFTVSFLKEQLKFLNDRLKNATDEIEEKSSIIQKLEHEKREISRQNENLEIENIKLAEKVKDFMLSQNSFNYSGSQKQKKSVILDSDAFRTPNMSKQQNKKVLEEDGIKCFDLERQSLIIGIDDENEFDLRQSIGMSKKMRSSILSDKQKSCKKQIIEQLQQNGPTVGEIGIGLDDQLMMIEEIERLKRENEELQNIIEKGEREKQSVSVSIENTFALKEELEILREESLIQGEELAKYQRHYSQIADELQFYKEQNNDLLKRLDDCERTLLSASENENNSSVIIYHETQKETQKLLKDENTALKSTIMKLKEEVKQLEMQKSRSESMRAEIEYNSRASEYNIEILKNQIENLNNENILIKQQNEKQKKSIEIMRSTNDRMSQDLDYYKKISLNNQKKDQRQGKNPANQNLTPIKQNSDVPMRSTTPQKFQAQTQQPEMNIENSILQDSIVVPPTISSDNQAQVNILDIKEIGIKDEQIAALQAEVEEKQRKIDDLEKQLQQLQAKPPIPNESDVLKKLRFDNQILMNKLSEYKKAEKNVKELVSDYEQMKLKYFNVLTENSNQKTQIQELIQSKLDSELALKDLNEEKQQYINELYVVRMDITKKIDEATKKGAQSSQLQEDLSHAQKKVAELMKKDMEIVQMQSDIEQFVSFFSQVDKHLKTLMKLLREFISRCNDPKLIEHNQKQIKSIETMLEEVKLTIRSKDYQQAPQSEAANKLIESFFMLSNDSLRDMQASALMNSTQCENENAELKKTQLISLKKRKLNEEGDFIQLKQESPIQIKSNEGPILLNFDSADEKGTIIGKTSVGNGLVNKKQKKIIEKTILSTAKKPAEFLAENTLRRSARK